MKIRILSTACVLTALMACGQSEEAKPTPSDSGAGHPLDSFYLESAPADAVEVAALRTMQNGATVSVRGDIQDFAPVQGKAVLSLYDHALPSCDENPDDQCQTPWDFCCVPDDEIAKASATVEFRQDGQLVAVDLKGFHGITYLSDVVVTGTLQLDDAGNARIAATGIHVE